MLLSLLVSATLSELLRLELLMWWVGVGVSGDKHSSLGVVLALSSSSLTRECSPSMVETVARLVASLLSYSASSDRPARYCLYLSALSWSACNIIIIITIINIIINIIINTKQLSNYP